MNKIILSTLTLLLVFVVGCTKFEDYESKKLADAPTVSLATEEIKDSSVVVSFTSSATGFLSFVLLEGVANATPDSTALIELNVDAFDGGSYEVLTAGEKIAHEFSGLQQNTVYEVFAVSQNADGVLSKVSDALMIKTSDAYAPVLDDVAPSISTTPEKAVDFEVTLTFDEPIGTVDASKFTFTYFLEDAEAKAGSAVVNEENPYEVIVTQSRSAHTRDYVFLSYDEGAVLDIVGNPVAAQISGLDEEGYLVGLYWRAVPEPFAFDVATFTPENGSAVSDPEFVIEFTAPVPVESDAADGDIKIIVVGSGVKSIYDVPAANILVDENGTGIQVVKPVAPTYGEMVYIEIAAGTFTDDYGNPNIVIESGIDGIAAEDDPITEIGWLISYGYEMDMILGMYTFNGINHSNPAYGTDQSFEVEIVADPENANQVLILGFYGSETPIPAVFNGDFATLTVAVPETDFLLGDLFGDGSETYFWSYDETQFVINILPNGDMVTDPYYWLALYWELDDENAGWLNVFVESNWEKIVADGSKSLKSAGMKRLPEISSNLSRNALVKN